MMHNVSEQAIMEMKHALKKFNFAASDLLDKWGVIDGESGTKGSEAYPFHEGFDKLTDDIDKWTKVFTEELDDMMSVIQTNNDLLTYIELSTIIMAIDESVSSTKTLPATKTVLIDLRNRLQMLLENTDRVVTIKTDM